MAHEGVKHDYHLVNPSPWPLIGSIAAFVLALGRVMWMKGLFGVPKAHLVAAGARRRRRRLSPWSPGGATW